MTDLRNIYTKAAAVTASDSTAYGTDGSPYFDALYLGDGNFEAGITASDLFDPKLWLKANAGVTDSGGAISAWADQSGNSHNAAATNAPTVEAGVDATNGLATIDFNPAGNDDGLKVTDHADFDFSSAFEMAVLVKFDLVNANRCVLSKDFYQNEWTWICDDGIMKFHVGGDDGIGSATLSTDTWYVVGISRGAASRQIQLFLNGATDGSAVGNTQDLTGTNDLYIGQRFNDPGWSQGLDGEIAEILVWKAELTSAQRAYVYTYLTDKWLNPQKADVAVKVDGVTTTLDKRAIGSIVEIFHATRVMATKTNATNIVALYKD